MTRQRLSQLGIVSWSVHVATPLEMARQVQKLGLRKIQMQMTLLADNPSVWADTPAIFRDHDIRIVSGELGLAHAVAEDQHRATNLDCTRRIGALCQETGVSLVTTHVGHIPDPKDASDHRKVLDRVAEIARILAQHGVRIAFETGPEESTRLMRFLAALDETGTPKIGINFDPANMLIYGTDDPATALRNFLPRVWQCHLKDATRAKPGEQYGPETPLGKGDVNWEDFFSVLTGAKYTGDLIVEREAEGDMLEDVRAGIARLSSLMQSSVYRLQAESVRPTVEPTKVGTPNRWRKP